MKIAVVGSGVGGLAAAWALSRRHEVVLFEAESRLGGHANTHVVHDGATTVAVDTGFIVYNEVNYPNLVRFFETLGVATHASDMSFGVSADAGGFEYSGEWRGLIAQPANLLRRRYWRMLGDGVRFYRSGPALLDEIAGTAADPEGPTLREVLARGRYSQDFAHDHLLPMAAAIWSSTVDQILDFPAETFLSFFKNHGLLNLGRRPQWRTVTGGSRQYVDRVARDLTGRVRTSTPIRSIHRTPGGVVLGDDAGNRDVFDQVVLATHPDQALALLGASATAAERAVLERFRYQPNLAILHQDTALMPRRRAVWSSWNYISESPADRGRHISLTYWMNRLQGLKTRRPLLLSLNPLRAPDPETVHARIMYRHPVMDRDTMRGQSELPLIQGSAGLWFCGAWTGYGFHEDGAQSGFSVAAALDAPVPWMDDVTPMSPAVAAVAPRPVKEVA